MCYAYSLLTGRRSADTVKGETRTLQHKGATAYLMTRAHIVSYQAMVFSASASDLTELYIDLVHSFDKMCR